MTTAAARDAGAVEGGRGGVAGRTLSFGPAVAGAAACLAAVAFAEGAYFPRTWYPAGLLAAALLVVIALARPEAALPPRGSRAGLALLAGWIALSGLSITWAVSKGAAWQATDKLLATLAVAVLVSLAPWRPRSAWTLFGVWAFGVALVAGVDLVSFAAAEHPGRWLLESRYLGPVGYANGTAALAALAFWPAMLLSARPSTAWPVRAALLPCTVLLLAWALLPSSRGTMIALVLMTPLALALSRHRWRLLMRLVVAAGAIAIAAEPLSEVYSASREERPLVPVVDTMADHVLVAVLVALAASVLLLALERFVTPPAGLTHLAGRSVRIAIVAGLLAVAAIGFAARGTISNELSDRWDAFTSTDEENVQTGARIGQVTSDKRADYWRIALDTFADRPLAGVGAGNYERRYTADKRYAKHSRYAHSLWMRALADTGIVGLLLLASGLVALLGALIRRRWRDGSEPDLIAAAGAASVGFFLQASIDWLEEVPALAAVALWLPLVALAATAPGERPRRPARLRAMPVLGLGVAALVALPAPWLAVRWTNRGDDLRQSDPQEAFADYDRAAGANPLDPTPLLRAGFLALDRRDYRLARAEFEEALEVEDGWVPQFELGLLDLRAGNFAAARRRLAHTRRLNRNDPVVAAAREAVRERRRVDPREINRLVLDAPVISDR